ncbi:hypothetical protein [Nocardiopsis dassonvillei]|uniref:hypothetical protein n=1 Tax=Nocardiopsis dassonvillei TaxID=2014 RepID=UPI0036417FD7
MRYWFGGQPSDYVVAPGEQVLLTDESVGYQPLLVPGVTLWVYDYETGDRLTDLLDGTGNPAEDLRTSDYGLIPRFRGPDEVRRVLIGPAPQPSGDEEQSSPGRWVLTSTDWPAIVAQVETRVAVLEDTSGGGEEGPEPVATAHPMIWSQAQVQARTSSHRYVNLEGRTQTVTVVRAEAAVVNGQVDVHLLTVDMVTGTATVGAAVSLTPEAPMNTVSPALSVSAGTGVTVGVEAAEGTEAEGLTVQVMIR